MADDGREQATSNGGAELESLSDEEIETKGTAVATEASVDDGDVGDDAGDDIGDDSGDDAGDDSGDVSDTSDSGDDSGDDS